MVHSGLKITESPIEYLNTLNGVELWIKRDDLIDEYVSGNKIFKLKFNIEQAIDQRKDTILTFGGAFSNHIAATSSYCAKAGLKSIGMIRGEESDKLNPTLLFALNQGMEIKFISRADYRMKEDPLFLEHLQSEHKNAFIVPEGGANALGIEGAKEMLNESTKRFDFIASAIGTGTTIAGILQASETYQKIIGIPIHKHSEIMLDVLNTCPELSPFIKKLSVIPDYHFGGYAKWNLELIDFIRSIFKTYSLKLDPIYTGKALFALIDQIEKGRFSEGKKVLFLHTGGLQGNKGFEERFDLKLFD